MDTYREDLTAARIRIEQLEDELALYRADPSFERVDIAEERRAEARTRRALVQKLLPRAAIASFVLMGGLALAQADAPDWLRWIGYSLFAIGLLAAPVTIALLLRRPRDLTDLERNVRIAKGDVGRIAASNPPPLLEAQNKTPDPMYGTIS